MTRKKNTKYRVMKKTSESEKALLRRIKNDVDMRTALSDIKATAFEYATVQENKKEITERNMKLKSIKAVDDEIRKDVIKITGVNKFSLPRNKKEVSATIEDLKYTCFRLNDLNEKIKSREDESRKRLELTTSSYYLLNQRDSLVKDKLALLQAPTKPKEDATRSREELQKRRDRLLKDIHLLTENFERKIILDQERRSSASKKETTLEQYLDSNIDNLRDKIHKYSLKIRSLNTEIKKFTELSEEKKADISTAKKTMKEISKKDILESEQYQKIVTQNEELQKELDAQISLKNQLCNETLELGDKFELMKKKCVEDTITIKEIREFMKDLEQKVNYKAFVEIEEHLGHDDMLNEIMCSEARLAKMSVETKKLEEEAKTGLSKLREVQNKKTDVDNENKILLSLIHNISQKALEKVIPFSVPLYCP